MQTQEKLDFIQNYNLFFFDSQLTLKREMEDVEVKGRVTTVARV